MCRKTHITHSLTLLNNIAPDVDEPVSRWKLNKANWVQFQTLSTTRLLEDTVRKADDPIESFASILINIAEETVPKTASKSKKTGGGRGWSGGAKVLGNLPVPGRPTNLDYSRARAYCACSRCGWGLCGHFYSQLSLLFSFSLSLGDGPI